jgi:hypothetical protein
MVRSNDSKSRALLLSGWLELERGAVELLHQLSTRARKESLELLELSITELAKRRCTLDVQLTRQQTHNKLEINVRLRLAHFLDHSSAVLVEVVAESLQRDLTQPISLTSRSARAAVPAGSKPS